MLECPHCHNQIPDYQLDELDTDTYAVNPDDVNLDYDIKLDTDHDYEYGIGNRDTSFTF